MPKYEIEIAVTHYFHFTVEEADRQEAVARAQLRFDRGERPEFGMHRDVTHVERVKEDEL